MAQSLGLDPEFYDGEHLRLVAPLAPNINDKGTAFGGSIYCVAVMSCWGMVYLQAKEFGLDEPNIVVSHGEIDYLKPVNGAIEATCEIDAAAFEQFWQDYQARGKAKIALHSKVLDKDGQLLARFSGRYAIIPA